MADQILTQFVHPLVFANKANGSLFLDSGAWDGHVDNYAEWIFNHPESDTSRDDYS
jgi:hypothetical protein